MKISTQQKQSLVVITTYPEKGKLHSQGVVGIAPCTKNTVVALKKNIPNIAVTVLAEKLPSEKKKPAIYQEDGITVKRIWKRNSITTFFSLFKEIYRNQKDRKKILMQFGLSIYGDLFYLIPLPLFLLALKIMGKEVYIVFHEVVPNISEVYGHINIEKNSANAFLINILLRSFYRINALLVQKCIVFEEVLKERLASVTKTKNISVIPIGVENYSYVPSKKEARRKLKLSQDSYLILCFGFLAWYKGTDWIAQAAESLQQKKGKKIQVVIAGGANPNRIGKSFYKKYVENIQRKCQENGTILTGFIREDDIPLYFQAADVLLFPYRAFMGASIALSLAFSFKKPFIVSEAMSGISKTRDMKYLLEKAKIQKEKLFFSNGNFSKRIMQLMNNSKDKNKIAYVSKLMIENRSWNVIARQYYKELFEN